ncbi:phosphotransferase [Aeromicrobium sp.]|uniref:phosphotransferase n=1 Tax=Aeromicrobium sp. TaxID=1871063 RepID=UPI0019C19647|nr:phosphotransferase [Aeromicrobium sp.]MBC7632178.1 phosphotransferase [Aeromicrobium sp.]
MGRPFSDRVAGADWRREVSAWISEQLQLRGHWVTGTIAQPRIRPWSTQLTVPTSEGLMWFKANAVGLTFEPGLQAELSRIAPHSVDKPYAIDAERGWMLTRELGETLGDSHELTEDDWRRLLGEVAAIQRAAADHRESLLIAGLPNFAPVTVLDRYDRVVEVFSSLPDGHPAHVSADLRGLLRTARPAIARAVDTLTESSLPVTWQHGDLHPGNVFAVGDRLKLFDFGDGQWAHAAEVMCVPYGWITTMTPHSWPAVLNAYREVWEVQSADLDDQLAAATLTQAVNRAVSWSTSLDEATAAEWAQWGAFPLHHLTRVLEP